MEWLYVTGVTGVVLVLCNRSDFSAMVESVLGIEALKERNRIYEVFSETFDLLKASWIAIDFRGFELLYQLGLSSNHLLHLTCFLNFLFHLVFQNTNPMKQVLSY